MTSLTISGVEEITSEYARKRGYQDMVEEITKAKVIVIEGSNFTIDILADDLCVGVYIDAVALMEFRSLQMMAPVNNFFLDGLHSYISERWTYFQKFTEYDWLHFFVDNVGFE